MQNYCSIFISSLLMSSLVFFIYAASVSASLQGLKRVPADISYSITQ